MSPLNITHHDALTGPVLHVAGDLDYAEATVLREQVESLALSPGQNLVIDLSGLEYCDSTGLTVLLAARQRAQTASADMALAAVPADTLRILTLTGLDQIFTIHPGSA
ncbi:anti-sigma factor antagonist [Streptomyces sp. SID1328]|uniref:STAS domain-containing protein n=1 Tax=Streptomyces sp. SID1328 TaxID=2690250 RepID=UPI001371AA1D|nr:STAS domain-containing protein [Streptomyces sp. SID1328]MYV39972.1 anti-sigma factor antagonist [Streptomyces sp. SID1328]